MSTDRLPTGSALRAAAELHSVEDHERLEVAVASVEATAPESVRQVLAAARDHLEMDVAFFSRFTADDLVVQRVHGDGRLLGLEPGTTVPLAETYCQRVVDGRLPNLIPDARHDERVADVPSKVGAYVGVPVGFDDGRLYGMLCCASRTAAPWLAERDIAFMRVLGRMLADQFERDELARTAQQFREEAVALGALLAGLDARDSYTSRHSEAVVELASEVTRELGMSASVAEEVRQVALLHDIGKLGIPDAVLAKPGSLDDSEWELMHRHPVIGEQIVSRIDSLAHLAPAIRAEHERWDGRGYPDGLTREQIPLASRITLACDAHHAMLSCRPYRAAMDAPAAEAELRANAGTQFDSTVVDALLRVAQR
jgi:GAF domain-containing protein